jgi:hypothetical protein
MKRILSIICLVAVLVVLSKTNPPRSEYVAWLNHNAMDKSSNLLEKGLFSLAGKPIFDMGTTETDYYLFTIYKTDFSSVGMGEVKSIGIFHQFIPISSKK